MKGFSRYLKVGLNNSLSSFMPVLIGILLIVCYGDSKYSEGFILTYPYQFIMLIGWDLFIIAPLSYSMDEGGKNTDRYGRSGLLLFLLYGLAIIIFTLIFWNVIQSWFNVDITYKSTFVFWVSGLVFDWLVAGIAYIDNYCSRFKNGLIVNISYYICKIVIVAVFGFINVPLYYTTVLFSSVAVLYYFKHCRCKFCFKLKKCIRYSIADLTTNVGMFMIYNFGLNNLAHNSYEHVQAYNIVSMASDTEWDIMSSGINTVTALDIGNGEFYKHYKRNILHAVLYSIVLFFIAVITAIELSFIYPNVNYKIVIVFAALEWLVFPLYGIGYTCATYNTIKHPGTYQGVLCAVQYISRFIVTMCISSNYSIGYGVLVSCAIGNLQKTLSFLYFKRKYKEEFICGK